MLAPQRCPSGTTAILAGVLVIGIGLRWWVLRSPLGAVDLDEATVGLQAMAFRAGRPATFFQGQRYGGTLETGLVALVTAIVGDRPMALKAVPIVLHLTAASIAWRTMRRLGADGWSAALAPGLLWVGSAALVWESTKERGFYGVAIVIAATMLHLIVRAATVDEPAPRDLALLGLVAGLALWTTPLLIAAIVPPMAWFVVVRRPGPRSLGLIVAGAAGGALPWITFLLRHGGPAFAAPPTFGTTYLDRLGGVPERLAVLIGVTPPWADAPPIGAALSLVVLGLALVAATWWSRAAAPGLLAVCIVGYALVVAGNGLLAGVGPDPRYLYPLAPAVAVCVASAVAALPPRRVAHGACAVVLTASALGIWRTAGLVDRASGDAPDQFLASPGLDEVVGLLDDAGRSVVMTDVVGHQLTYLSGARIEAATFAVPRFESLEHAGRAHGCSTYVLRRGVLGTTERLVAHLRARRIGFERLRVGAFDVLLLDRPVDPADVPLVVFGGAATRPPR